MHMIVSIQKIFKREKLDRLAAALRPYHIQSTSSQTGVMEAMMDAESVDQGKRMLLKAGHNPATLEAYYRLRFGTDSSRDEEAAPDGASGEAVSLEQAKRNCMCSTAAYAIVQYVLLLKDRHNGNILVDSVGRMVHIDLAFMLGWAPGGITFEKPAFKLTKDMVDVWGGKGSPLWTEFVELMFAGMQAVQTHHLAIERNIEIAAASGANFPCFRAGIPTKKIMSQLRDRFKLYKSKRKLHRWVERTIEYAYDNFWTSSYAKFQLLTNGIVP